MMKTSIKTKRLLIGLTFVAFCCFIAAAFNFSMPLYAFAKNSEIEDFAALKAALYSAEDGDTIEYFGNEISQSLTIRKGVTLKLKFNNYDSEDFIPLDIDSGVTITVDGVLIVGDFCGSVFSGDFFKSAVNLDGKIIINGEAEVNLPIKGKGSAIVNGKLTEPFYVSDFVETANFKRSFAEKISPFNEFLGSVITCNKIINGGGIKVGKIVAGESVRGSVNLIGNTEESFIFTDASSVIDVAYDEKTVVNDGVKRRKIFGKTILNVFGNVKINRPKLFLFDEVFNFDGVAFPLPYNYDVVLKENSTVAISHDAFLKVLPGAKVQVNETAELKINGSLSVYDGLYSYAEDGYPRTDSLYASGFSKCGSLICNGTLNIAGAFSGTVQTTGLSGKIKISESAKLSAVLEEGCKADKNLGYEKILQTAKAAGFNDFYDLECGKVYKSYDITPKTLDYVVVDEIAIKGGKILKKQKLYTYQSYLGRFLEFSNDKFYQKLNVFIGEKVKNVCINVCGREYYTDENGEFVVLAEITDKSPKITYFTPKYETGEVLSEVSLSLDEKVVLDKVVKGVKLSEENNYEVFENSVKSFYAHVGYYGGGYDEIEVFPEKSTSNYYVEKVNFTCKGYKILEELSSFLYFYKPSFDEYKSCVNGLIDALFLIDDCKNAYKKLTDLAEKRSKREIDYLNTVLKDYFDYLSIPIDFSLSAIEYGTIKSNAVAVCLDGSKKEIEVSVSNYRIESGDIVAIASYFGTYNGLSYVVEKPVYNVSPAKITYFIDDKSTCYLDALSPLTGRIAKGELKFTDTEDMIRLYTSAKIGSEVGGYYITGECLSPFYQVSFVNASYFITKKTVELTVEDKIVKFSESKNIRFNLKCEYPFSVTAYDVYRGGEKVAIIDLYGNLSNDLAVGEYQIQAVLDDKNFTQKTVKTSTLRIIKDDENYAVSFGFTNGTVKTYDEKPLDVSISVTDLKTQKYVDKKDFSVTIYKNASPVEEILDVGDYTVQVEVFGEVFTSNVTVLSFGLTISFNDINIFYGDALPEISYTVLEKTIPNGTLKYYFFDGKVVFESLNENYRVDKVLGTVNVLPRPITVACEPSFKYYGDTYEKIVLKLTSGSLAARDTLDKVVKVERKSGETVGDYEIVLNEEFIDENRYAVTLIASSFKILPRKITVAQDDITVCYKESFSLSPTLVSGSLGFSDELSSVVRYEIQDGDLSVGKYPILCDVVNDNYEVTFLQSFLTVVPKKLTIKIFDGVKTYGEADDLTFAVTDDKTNGEIVLKDIISVYRDVGEDIGKYPITAKSLNANYDITFDYTKGSYSVYEITPKKVALKINDLEVDFTLSDEDIFSKIEYTVLEGGLSFSDTLTPKYYFTKDGKETDKSVFGTTDAIGSYEIHCTVLSDNYVVTVINGKLTVGKKIIGVKDLIYAYVYNGKEILPFDPLVNIFEKDLEDVEFNKIYEVLTKDGLVITDKIVNAGNYKVTVTVFSDHYKFLNGNEYAFEIVVEKADLSNFIIVDLGDCDFVVIGKNRPIARLVDYEADLNVKLYQDDILKEDFSKEGKYSLKVTITDDNYRGEKTFVFFAYNDVSPKIEKVFTLLKEYKTEPSLRLTKLKEIKNYLNGFSVGDNLQIQNNSAYKLIIDDFCQEYEKFLKEETQKFDIVISVYEGVNSFPYLLALAAPFVSALLKKIFKGGLK